MLIRKIIVHFSIFLFLFLLINILANLVWYGIGQKVYSKHFKKKYSNKELEIIGIKKKDAYQFYFENWINKKFEYKEFVGYVEKKTNLQKYVNVNENGRFVAVQKNCKNNINFYGASRVFGYNAADNQTISYHFYQKIKNDKLLKNFCVRNFGNAYYYYAQENMLLNKHILENKILENDIIIFLDGFDETGYQFTSIEKKFADSVSNTNNYLSTLNSLKTLLSEFILVKYFLKAHNHSIGKKENTEKNYSKKNSRNLLNNNLRVRKGICEEFNINCYTFFHPIRTDFYDERQKKIFFDNYDYIVKKNKYLVNMKKFKDLTLSPEIVKNNEVHFIDKVHYSSVGSKFLSNEIYKFLKKTYIKK